MSLLQALQQWCEPALVERVRSEERQLSEYELNQTSRVQLTPTTERRRPTSTSWKVDTDLTNWLAAWHALENDLRQRITAGEIFVRGVQAKPQRRRDPEPIPGAWAADFAFDFAVGTIGVGEYRFTAVTCSREPWPEREPLAGQPPPAPPVPSPAPLRPEDVPDLDDETVLALLEENARRVAAKPDTQLFPPGKISLMPLIRRRMEFRAGAGELLPSLAGEAAALKAWIASKVPSHQVPSAKATLLAKCDGPGQASVDGASP